MGIQRKHDRAKHGELGLSTYTSCSHHSGARLNRYLIPRGPRCRQCATRAGSEEPGMSSRMNRVSELDARDGRQVPGAFVI